MGGVVLSTDDKYAVLSEILASGGGLAIARGAQISCMVHSPKTSTTTVTSADVVGEIELVNSTNYRTRINRTVPRYREETQGWEMVAAEHVTANTYLVEDDNEQKSREIDFPLVTKVRQARQLGAYELVNSREFLTLNMRVKPHLLSVRVGDLITVYVPEIASNAIHMLVVGRSFDMSSQTVTLSLKSENNAKHEFALGLQGVAPASPNLARHDPTIMNGPAVADWSVSGTTVASAAGDRAPVIRLTGICDDPNVQEILVDISRDNGTTWTAGGVYPRGSQIIDVTGVAPNTAYKVRIYYRTVNRVLSPSQTYDATSGGLGLAIVDDIVNDAMLDPSEKPRIIRDYDRAVAERASLVGLANFHNIVLERDAYTNAFDRLTSHLNGIFPLYTDLTTSSPIEPDNFKVRWVEYYSFRDNLQAKIADRGGRAGGIGSNMVADQYFADPFPWYQTNGGATGVNWTFTNASNSPASMTAFGMPSAVALSGGGATTSIYREAFINMPETPSIPSIRKYRVNVHWYCETASTGGAPARVMLVAKRGDGTINYNSVDIHPATVAAGSKGSINVFIEVPFDTVTITPRIHRNIPANSSLSGKVHYSNFLVSPVSISDAVIGTDGSRIIEDGRLQNPLFYNTQSLLGPRNSTNIQPSYTVNASNVTVNLPAHTRVVTGPNGPYDLYYGAASFVWPFSTAFSAYTDDPNLTGSSSPAVVGTGAARDLYYRGRYEVANGRTPDAAGTGGTTYTGGGGGGGGFNDRPALQQQ